MLRQVGISGALSAVFALLLLPAYPASAFEAPASFEVSEYSKDFGVSAGVAEERLETQQSGAAIVAELKLALGGGYAGVWFDNEKGEFVVPLLRGTDRGAVAAKLSARGLSNYRTALAEFSWEELEAAQKRVDQSLHGLVGKGLTQTFLDSRANAVVIRQAQAANQVQQGTIASVAGRERGRVQVRSQDAEKLQITPSSCQFTPSLCDAPLRGGVGIWPNGSVYPWMPDYATCSVGFKALGNVNGNRFVLTAGHCAEAAGEWQSPPFSYTNPGYIGAIQEYVTAPASDYAKIKANGNYWDKPSWPVKVAYWGTNQEQAINYEAYSYIGQYVCHAGANSGASCGTVTALNLVSHQPEGDIYNRTEVQTICSKGGDSGGPVFTGDTALGIFTHNNVGVEGENPEYCHEKGYYTEITEAADAMGVTVGYRIGGAPFVTTNPATNIQATQATANGEVNPNSVETHYRFEYGTTASYGSFLPAPEGNAGHGTGTVGVNVTLQNLKPETTYHYRVVAANAASTTYGGDVQVKTAPTPTYITEVDSDVSGDGKADLLGREANGTVKVYVSTGTGFKEPTSWGGFANALMPMYLADVSGDGKADLLGREANGTVKVYVSTGTGFKEPTSWGGFADVLMPMRVVDVSGDGKADLLGREANGTVKVYVSTGTGFKEPTSWGGFADVLMPMRVVDVSGDGKADLLGREANGTVRVYESAGSGFKEPTSWGGFADVLMPMYLADVSGDGKADLLGREANGTVKVYVSAGTGFKEPTSWGGFAGVFMPMRVADVSGDGKADLLGREANGTVKVYVSAGTGFKEPTSWGGFADVLMPMRVAGPTP